MYTKSASELNKLFLAGSLTAEEITLHFLQRTNKFNKELGSFVTLLEQESIEKARLLDKRRKKGERLGKFAAVPVAIKDNIHIKGVKTTCASKFLENYHALFDATAINRLKNEDAIFIGKTNLDEFAMGSSTEHSGFFQTKNPWNLRCTPGGSSGGSAAAVCARLCPIAFGSDTGGSIRQPAAFTGTVGFKPTYGRVSRYGLVAFGSSFDQIGPITTTVEDVALAMEVIGGNCSHDATSLPDPNPIYTKELSLSIGGKTVGIDYSTIQHLSGDEKKLFEDSIAVLKKLGLNIKEINLPSLKYSVAMYYILATAEASTNLARFDGIGFSKRSTRAQTLDEVYEFSKHDGFGPEVRRRILLGTYVLSAGYQDAFYVKAQKVRTLMIKEFEQAFQQCDIILMPTSASTAFELGSIQDPLQMYLQDIYTINANLTGMPAISVPCGFDSKKLPFAIQFIGPQKEDARVLRFGYHFEQYLSNRETIPPNYVQ
ncbi:MAG: Asp-tRNA(Asn)/Glu-tRNA(Gln) amidotransferase subunit GatA [Chlamydiales bacterium]|nr:Asp-tRNA(Asn)/Glu-tRNA(Gln) amidotransferase subunit GatA [Chlamydiales bacterium]